ncbi:DUF4838 domain-containing protein [Prosthecobacter sp.]|uniref:DUF4838 domain-containing protein n=1 Tax=Prosthecobacter sp. TaxID=1965333 RepID=UPI003783F3E0
MKPLPVLFLLVLSAVPAAGAFLVQDGQAKAEIVISEKPARMTKLAAKELQAYVEKISGARLEIVTQPHAGKTPVYVGKSHFTEDLKLSAEGLKDGAFLMAAGASWLALLGPDEDFVPIEPWGRNRSVGETTRVNAEFDKITGDTFWNHHRDVHARYHKDLDVWDYDDAGTLNAVYEFLRSLGVRWYAPGDLGEVVPSMKSIPQPEVNKTVVPDFGMRRFTFYTDHTGIGDKAIWCFRLGLNNGHKIGGITQICHGAKFVLMRDEMKQAHPEMYLLTGGRRDTTTKGSGYPDLTSAVFFEKHLKYARAMFDHFKEPMLSIDLVDGYGGMTSDDPKWMAQLTPERGWSGSMSDHVFGYLNRLALELNKSHPDRLVSGLAYSAYKLPPEKIEKMSPNFVLIETRQRQSFWDEAKHKEHQDMRAAWTKKLAPDRYLTWDYSINARPEQAGRPVYYTHQISRDLRELKGHTLGEMIEIYDHPAGRESTFGYDPFAIEHLNLYITSRLWWDASQDVDALVSEYLNAYYGPAAAAMQAFIQYSEANWMHMGQDAGKIGTALALFAKAQDSVDPQCAPGRRLQKIADIMKPLKALQQQLSRKRETDADYRVLEAHQTGGKPLTSRPFDGQVLKDYWTEARSAALTKLSPAAPHPKAFTHFQIQRQDSILHVGIICQEPDMPGMNIATTASDDPKLLEGDHVTLLIESQSRNYYEIAINPAGAILEIDHANGGKGVNWASGAQCAVHRGDKLWSIELRLPIIGEGAFALDPLKGIDGAQPKSLFPWHFNLCRQRVRGGTVERTAYVPTGKDTFYVPEKFAKMWGK